MQILITGANGLLGQHLVKLLKEEKSFRVIATSRGENRLKNKDGYQYLPLNIESEEEVKKVISSIKPDIIIHSAAMTQVDDCETKKEQCWQANVKATQYLISAAKAVNSFFLLRSTDFIFDGAAGPYDENAAPNPLSYYGVSKLAAEMLLLESGLRWAIARTILVYGIAEDMSRSNIILWVKKNLEQDKSINVVTDQWRTPTLVQEGALCCKVIAEKKANGVFNISGKDLLTPYGRSIKTADYFHLDKSLIKKADASTFTQAAKRPVRTGFIIKKAESILGYQPHSFEEGISIMAREM